MVTFAGAWRATEFIPQSWSACRGVLTPAARGGAGHWEGDLVFGARRSAVATLVDRATRYTMVVALPDGNRADAVAAALIEHMGRLPIQLRRSLTWDRGSEMARHARDHHRAVDAGVLLRPAPPMAARYQ